MLRAYVHNSKLKNAAIRMVFQYWVTFSRRYHLAGITVKLQSRAIDIVDAYNSIDENLSLYKQMRSNVEGTFVTVYKHAGTVAATANVQTSQPRIIM